MKLAYIISAYKLPEQLVRLVRRLWQDSATFLIHVDARTPSDVYGRMAAPLRPLSNVHFLPRHPCYWGDFGHVRATLKGIRALAEREVEFEYVFLLTGQDYPIRPVTEIEGYLERHRGREFMEASPLPVAHWDDSDGGLRRIAYWHFRFGGKLLRFPEPLAAQWRTADRLPAHLFSALFWSPLIRAFPRKRSFPPGLQPYGGGSYWCLSRECVRHIADFLLARPDYTRFFRHVDIPDEIFFQTIVLNSPFRDRVTNYDLHYIRWPGPQILQIADFDALRQSDRLFARKFDVTQDAEILDRLDRYLETGG